MAKLNEEQRAFVVQRLAMFDTPTQVADAVKEEYGIVIDRQAVRSYNPEQTTPAKKWCALFEATRKQFLETVSDIPIANRAVRLRSLYRMALAAEKSKNYGLAAQLHEQAAKEVGDLYTNTRNLKHDVAAGGVLAVPIPVGDEQWGAMAVAQQAALASRPPTTSQASSQASSLRADQ